MGRVPLNLDEQSSVADSAAVCLSLSKWLVALTESRLSQCLADRRLQCDESRLYICTDMHAQRSSPALRKDREIPTRLRCNDTECIFLLGNGKVLGVVACDPQEDAAAGARPCKPVLSNAESAAQRLSRSEPAATAHDRPRS
jgi:hypothetical protein